MATKAISLKALAKRLGVTASAVSQAVKAGRLEGTYKRKGRGYAFEPEAAEAAWFGGKLPASVEEAISELEGATLHDARLVHEKYKARLAAIRVAAEEGRVVGRDTVARQAFEAGKAVKSALLAIPPRLAELVAAEDDPAACRTLIESEIRQALEELPDAL